MALRKIDSERKPRLKFQQPQEYASEGFQMTRKVGINTRPSIDELLSLSPEFISKENHRVRLLGTSVSRVDTTFGSSSSGS